MTRQTFLDLSLYLITDPLMARDRPVLDVVAEAVRGGVTIVQIRDKQADARNLLEQTLALKAYLAPKGIPLVVNDRVDVAAAAGVGCHVGQSDLPITAARALIGDEVLLGLSLDDPAQTATADPGLLDYIAHGPFAATGSKADAGAPVGKEGITRVRTDTALPLVAIGGLGPANARDAIEAGADGISVISAIMAADDPRAATAELRSCIDQALAGREGRIA